MSTVNWALKIKIVEVGTTQRKLAESLGIGDDVVSNIVLGRRCPTEDLANGFARLLHTTPEDLFNKIQRKLPIQAAMDALHLTAWDLHHRTQISRWRVHSITRGHAIATECEQHAIAKALGRSVAELFEPEIVAR